MGFFRSVFLLVLLLVFILTSCFFQLIFAINNTALSTGFITETFNQSGMNDFLTDQLFNQITNLGKPGNEENSDAAGNIENSDENSSENSTNTDKSGSNELNQSNDINTNTGIGEEVAKYIDRNWLSNELYNTIAGLHAYLTGSAGKLPLINIRSAKEDLFQFLVDQLASQETTSQSLKNLSEVITTLDTKFKNRILDGEDQNNIFNDLLNEKAIIKSELAGNNELLRGVLDAYSTIIKKDIDMNGGIGENTTISDNETFAIEIMKQFLKTKLNYEKMKDEIDTNDIVMLIFKQDENPLLSIREFILTIKTSIIVTLGITLLLILILMAAIGGRLNIFSPWIATALIISGLGGVSSIVFSKYLKLDGAPPPLTEWVDSMIKGFARFLSIGGLLLVITGSVLLIATMLVRVDWKLPAFIRVILIIIVPIVIILLSTSAYKVVSEKVEKLISFTGDKLVFNQNVNGEADSQSENVDFMKIIEKILIEE